MRLIALLFVVILGAGLFEMERHRRKRLLVPIRIHVNGSRGKSSVTRLIAAGLRAGGIRTYAKTTGSAARVIHTDGSETALYRQGPPNIREQLKIFRQATREKAEALVIECMAVRPDLQRISEHQIVRATHGVITNVRPDHLEAMGPREVDVAISLASTIPGQAAFFTGEDRYTDLMAEKAQSMGSSFHVADPGSVAPEELGGFSYVEFPDNLALALDVCNSVGVDRDTALAGMKRARHDPGALVPLRLDAQGKDIRFFNIFAANDPVSTAFVWNQLGLGDTPETSMVLVNVRADRMRRTKDLAPLLGNEIRCAHYVLVGEMTYVLAAMLRRQGVAADLIADLGGESAESIWSHLQEQSGPESDIAGIGNMGGVGMRLLNLLEEGEVRPWIRL